MQAACSSDSMWCNNVQVVETSPSQFFCPESRGKLIGDKRWGYLDYQYMHQVIRQEKLGKMTG